MKKYLFYLFLLALGYAEQIAAQDLILYGGYTTAEPSTFKRGWNVGLIGRYDFTNKFSQDLGLTYGHANFNEIYLSGTANATKVYSHTDLFSIRTHSVFNVINTQKERFGFGIGPCVNFYSTNSEIQNGATNVGLGMLLGYETHAFLKSPFGFFTRVRYEYDPEFFDQQPGEYSPFKEPMSAVEFNIGLTYTIKNKAQ